MYLDVYNVYTIYYIPRGCNSITERLCWLCQMSYSFGKALSLLPRAYAFTTAVLPPNIRSNKDCLFFRRTLNTSLQTSRNTSAICPTCSAAATSVKQHSKSFANISPVTPQRYIKEI